MKTAIFPGSFDPFTLGHADIVQRGLQLFDKVVIAIGVNPDKKTLFSAEERLQQICSCYADQPRVEVMLWQGLMVDLARQLQADCFLKGVRSVVDFEYERTMAAVNAQISDPSVETCLLYARPELESLQSSVVRELLHHGADVSAFLPQAVLSQIKR